MKREKAEIELQTEAVPAAGAKAYEKACCFLLKRYCEGREEFESIDIFEGIDGGSGRKRLFNSRTEGRGGE